MFNTVHGTGRSLSAITWSNDNYLNYFIDGIVHTIFFIYGECARQSHIFISAQLKGSL